MLSWAHTVFAGLFGALLVGGCGAQAVSRKTPIYFILCNESEITLQVFRDMKLPLEW